MDTTRIVIGADHAGYRLKAAIITHLEQQGIETLDLGTDSEESVDYPDFVHPLAEKIERHEFETGILICGSANGVAMAANKHQGVRAAICWNEEVAQLARQHNNANILCLPARFISDAEARLITDLFLATPFEGGRHARRVDKIPNQQ